MAVDVAPGLVKQMRQANGSFMFQVRASEDVGPAVLDGLRRAAEGLWAIEHTDEPGGSQVKYISEPTWVPSGCVQYVDMPDADTKQLRRATEIIVEGLTAAGVSDATVGYPNERGLMHAESRYGARHEGCGTAPGPHLLVARDYLAHLDSPIPSSWVSAAAAWIAETEPVEVWFDVMASVEFRVDPSTVGEWFERAPAFAFGARAGALNTRVRKVQFSGVDALHLAVQGPALTLPEMEVLTEHLIEVGRGLMPDAEYAAIDIAASEASAGNDPRYQDRWDDPTFDIDIYPMHFRTPFPFGRHDDQDYFRDGRPDPWHWQCISSTWASRFRSLPPGSVTHADGTVEFRFGELRAWAERSADLPAIVRRGRESLKPLRDYSRGR